MTTSLTEWTIGWSTSPDVAAVADVAESPGGEGSPLAAVEAFLGRFVAYPSDHARVAATLWAAHAHLMDAWESTPRLAHLSPEPGSGKTRALEVLDLLVPRPLHAVNATPAALFRKVGQEDGLPTVLFDEIDTIFGPKAKDNEDLRGLLNAGHRRGATALRCVVRGKAVEVEEFPAYCAVALAGLGDLPDTILTRSVVIRMRRRAPGERVEPFRRRVHADEGHRLREELADWARAVEPAVAGAWPEMPDGIEDRAADLWEPLLAVADAAGGEWPDRARVAAVALVADLADRPASLGVRLLGDLRAVFDELDAEDLSTEVLLDRLCGLDEAPWGDLRGQPLDSRGLANRLRPYTVRSHNLRVQGVGSGRVVKGYRRADLQDAWSRYLPASSATAATAATRPVCAVCGLPLDPALYALDQRPQHPGCEPS